MHSRISVKRFILLKSLGSVAGYHDLFGGNLRSDGVWGEAPFKKGNKTNEAYL